LNINNGQIETCADSLEEIIKMVADKEWEKQKKEYQKVIAENGNGNDNYH